MKSILLHTALLSGLVALVAYQPWQQFNRAIGLQPTPVNALKGVGETLVIEQPKITLAPQKADSLIKIVEQKKKQEQFLAERLADLERDTPKLRKKLERANRRYTELANEQAATLAKRDSLLGERKDSPKVATSATPTGTWPRLRGQDSSTRTSHFVSRGLKPVASPPASY